MRSALSLVLLSACSLWGCSSDHDAVEKRLSELRNDIQKLQTSNDALSDRLDSLETKVASSPTPAPGTNEKRVERPPPRVVKLVPGAEGEVAPDGTPGEVSPDERPDAPGQRPMIRVRGGSSKDSRSGSDTLARQSEDNR